MWKPRRPHARLLRALGLGAGVAACTPPPFQATPEQSPQDASLTDEPATPADAGPAIRFVFAWPEGGAVVTQTRRWVAAGNENSETTVRWRMAAETTDVTGLTVECSDFEVLSTHGAAGRSTVMDVRHMVGKIRVDQTGALQEVLSVDPMPEAVDRLEVARHPPSDSPSGFRAGLAATLRSRGRLEQVTRATWAGLVTNAAGRVFTEDQVVSGSSTKTLPYGKGLEIATDVEWRVEADVACFERGPASCARIVVTHRPAQPAKAAAQLQRALTTAPDGELEFEAGWDAALVTDPASLRPYLWVQREHVVVHNGDDVAQSRVEVSTRFDWSQ